MREATKSTTKRRFFSRLKFNELNVPARSSLFFTLTNLFCKGAAFLFTPIFTRLLSPAEYGEFSIFSTLLSLSTVAATMEMSGGVIMRLFQKERDKRSLSILSAWIISVALAIPITLLLFFINGAGGFGMGFGMMPPGGMGGPGGFQGGMTPPEGMEMPEGAEFPGGFQGGMMPPEGMEMPNRVNLDKGY